MKTKDYVKKYRLNESDKFDHKEFVSDLTFDFLTLLEVGKAKDNIKGYDNSVRAIRMKWEAINNKTVGQLPVKLWNYFYATVIAKMKEQLFPEIMKQRRLDAEERKRYKEQRQKYNNPFGGYNDFFFYSMLKSMLSVRMPVDSFNILGIPYDCTVDDVNSAYRKLVMEHHPDKGGKQDKFIEITEAKNKCLSYLNL